MQIENLKLPEIKPEHLPYAYGLMAIGALALVKKPTTLISLVSAYFMWQSVVEKGKKSIFG